MTCARLLALLAAVALAVASQGFAQVIPKGAEPGDPEQVNAMIQENRRLTEQNRRLEIKLAQVKAQAAQLARKVGVRDTVIIAIARRIGEAEPGIGYDRLIMLVEQQGLENARLRGQLSAMETAFAQAAASPARDRAERLLAQAHSALDASRLEEADRLLDQLETLHRSALSASRASLAQVVLARAGVARQLLHFDAARARYRSLAEELPAGDVRGHWQVVMGLAATDYEEGLLRADATLLQRAANAYRDEALPLAPRAGRPLDHAVNQNNLGNALEAAGSRRGEPAALRSAIAAYGAAMEIWTETSAPVEWARAQSNLGTVFFELSAMSGLERDADDAIAAYGSALRVLDLRGAAVDRAMVRNNLGNALTFRGDMGQGSIPMLRKAVAAYEEALVDLPRASLPYLWATTKNNLGNALTALGQRDPNPDPWLRAAVDAFQDALKVRTYQTSPYDWAMTQNNLGMALQERGLAAKDVALLEDAVAAYREALRVRTLTDLPFPFALTSENLGSALIAIAKLNGRCDVARESETVMREAARVFAAPQYARNRASVAPRLAVAAALHERLCRGRPRSTPKP